MSTFRAILVSPEELVFSGEVDQVDLPGAEGDLGILAGHTPIVIMLRPGIVKIRAGASDKRFVVLGGLAESSQTELTILAELAQSVEDFDVGGLKAQIEEMEESLQQKVPGEELDRAIAQLDHYRSLHVQLSPTTAF